MPSNILLLYFHLHFSFYHLNNLLQTMFEGRRLCVLRTFPLQMLLESYKNNRPNLLKLLSDNKYSDRYVLPLLPGHSLNNSFNNVCLLCWEITKGFRHICNGCWSRTTHCIKSFISSLNSFSSASGW